MGEICVQLERRTGSFYVGGDVSALKDGGRGTLREGTTEVVSGEGRGESKKNLREAIKSGNAPVLTSFVPT